MFTPESSSGTVVVQAGQVVGAQHAVADAVHLRAAVHAVVVTAEIGPLVRAQDDDGIGLVRPVQQGGHGALHELVGVAQLLVEELRLRLAVRLILEHAPAPVGQHVGRMRQQDVGEDELPAGRPTQVLHLADGEEGHVAMLGARRRVRLLAPGQLLQGGQDGASLEHGPELGRLAQAEHLVGDGARARRFPPGPDVVEAVALLAQERTHCVSGHQLAGRRAVAAVTAHRLGQVVQVAHVQRGGQAEVAGVVVGPRAGNDLEAHGLEVRIEVVLDPVGLLERPVGAVAVEVQEVDVPFRFPRRLDDDVVRDGLALRGAHGSRRLGRHDRDQRHGHQDQREDVEAGGHGGERALGAERVDADGHDEDAPGHELHLVGDVRPLELEGGMAEEQHGQQDG